MQAMQAMQARFRTTFEAVLKKHGLEDK